MFGRHRHTDSDPLLMGLGSSPSHQLKKTVVKDELDPLCIKNLDPRMCTQIIVLQLDACMQSKRNITSPYVKPQLHCHDFGHDGATTHPDLSSRDASA